MKIVVRMPSDSVTAKPRTGPVPMKNRMEAAMKVVRLASMMVASARAKPGIERRRRRAAEALLLAHALVDEHVGIDGHADGEDEAGDAGQGQRRAERRHEAEDEHHVDDQRDRRQDAEEAVGRHHEDGRGQRAGDRGGDAGPDRILAEAGPDGPLLDDGQLRRQGASPQQHGEVVGLLDGEAARDLARSPRDRLQDARRRDDLVVEHDGEGAADILGCRLPEALGAAQVEAEIDDRLVGALIEARLRVGQIAALDDDAALDRNALPFIVARRQEVDVGGARLCEHAEFQLRGPAEELLEALRILKARHLHEHAVGALTLDVRLGRADRIDAAAQHLDHLLDGAPHALRHALLGEDELDEPVGRLGDGQRAGAGLAEDRIRDRLRQLAQLRHEARAAGRVADAKLDAARLHLDAALEPDAGLAQRAPHVVAQLHGLRAQEVGHVDLEQHVRAALQVEPEHDGAGRHQPRRRPGRHRLPDRFAPLARQEVRHGEKAPEQDHRHDGDHLPSGEAKHRSNLSGGPAAPGRSRCVLIDAIKTHERDRF